MQIRVRVKRLGAGFKGAAKQQAFALANAFNKTTLEDQTAQRAAIRRNMTVRNETFIDRLVKIRPEDKARRDRVVARIRIEGPAGLRQEFGAEQNRGIILTQIGRAHV